MAPCRFPATAARTRGASEPEYWGSRSADTREKLRLRARPGKGAPALTQADVPDAQWGKVLAGRRRRVARLRGGPVRGRGVHLGRRHAAGNADTDAGTLVESGLGRVLHGLRQRGRLRAVGRQHN